MTLIASGKVWQAQFFDGPFPRKISPLGGAATRAAAERGGHPKATCLNRWLFVGHNSRSMNRLAAILPVTHVLVGVEATSKKRAFEEAGLLFEHLNGLSRALVTDSLFSRERLGSTGLGHGVAIPHGRIKGLKTPSAAILKLAQPIGFDAPDEQPVALLIFLLVPEAATQKHLEILSEIAEMLSDSGLRAQLAASPDAAHLHRLIHGWQSAMVA